MTVADGAPIQLALGVYESPTLAEITVSGVLDYSGLNGGYYPGEAGVLDFQGRWIPSRCASQVSVRVMGVGAVGGAFGYCPSGWQGLGSLTTYAVVSGALSVERTAPAPGACYYGSAPCASISGAQTVTVTPVPGELKITVTLTQTTPGGLIGAKFTPDPDYAYGKAMPYSIREIRFEGSGPVLGGGQTTGCTSWPKPNECSFRLYQSGYLVAEGVVSGRLKITRQWLTMVGGDSVPPQPPDTVPPDSIPTDTLPTDTLPGGGGGGCSSAQPGGPQATPCEPPPPVVTLKCEDAAHSSQITRGQTVSCTVKAAPTVAFVVDSVVTTAGAFTVRDSTPVAVAGGDTFVTSGPALLGSRVRAWVTLDSSGTAVQRALGDSFTVQARVWPELDSLTPTPALHRHTVDPGGKVDTLPHPITGTTSYTMRMGINDPGQPEFYDTTMVAKAQSGPNEGLLYYVRPLTFAGPDQIYTTPVFTNAQFLLDQNGGAGAVVPRCTAVDFLGAYQAEVERHEGVSMASSSHWGIRRIRLAQLGLNAKAEALVKASLSVWGPMTEVYDEYDTWMRTIHDPAQVSFDGIDVPQVSINAGCEPDFDHTDP